jgi:hypothetical protein
MVMFAYRLVRNVTSIGTSLSLRVLPWARGNGEHAKRCPHGESFEDSLADRGVLGLDRPRLGPKLLALLLGETKASPPCSPAC